MNSMRADQQRTDRQVDEEAHTPGHQIRQCAPQHQTDARADAGHRAVPAQRAATLMALGEVGGDQRQRGRYEDRGAHALRGARSDQPGRRLRQSDGQRGQREQRQPGYEHASPAQQIPGAGTQQEQAAEGQRIGVLHPGQARVRKAQAVADRGQTGDDDRNVEHDHQVARQDDRQHQVARRPVGKRMGGGHGVVTGVAFATIVPRLRA